LKSFFITVATIAGLLCIVPLWIWGATGNWRHAWHAGKTYWKLLGFMFAVGAGVGLIVTLAPV